MKHFLFRTGLAVAMTVLAAAAPAAAEERPFRAGGEGGILPPTFAASGEATHLGHSLLYAQIDYDRLRDEGRLVLSNALLASADGEAVYLNINVTLDLDTGVAVGTVEFAGGTGRFQGATGSADVMFVVADDLSSFTSARWLRA
jgi:hypothetical protein